MLTPTHRERYEAVVLRTGPVAYLPLQGKVALDLARQVAWTVSNATVAQRGPFPGAQGAAFDGSGDGISVTTNAAYHPGDTFSVGGWVQRNGSGTGGCIIWHNGTNDFTLWFESSSGSLTNSLALRKAGVGNVFYTSTTYTDTPWMHVIAVKNAGTSAAIYINGASAAGTYSDRTIVGGTATPTLGLVSGGTGNPLDGALAHIGLWNRVLSEAEVLTLYRAGKAAT